MEDVARTRMGEPGAVVCTHSLEPGQSLTFGRGADGVVVDVAVPLPEVSRLAGTIHAVGDYWLLTNASSHATYVVENLEGGGEHVKVPPLRIDAPVPFEISRLLLPTGRGAYALHVYAPQHSYADPRVAADPTGDMTVQPFALDSTAKYFRVLVALCEPRLRDPSSVVIPTSQQVAIRLARANQDRRVSRSTVDYHINYLAETKLRLKPPGDGSGGRTDAKRGSLVTVALRFNLVTEEHLVLLPAAGPRKLRRG